MDEDAVRWSIKVSKSTDVAVRSLLAQKGLKKGDLSKFIEQAARWRVFQQTVQEARARNAHVPSEEIEAEIEEALQEVRAERFGTRR
jgi:seryl-tRNA synthetase